jgi:hypothetical protein
VQRNDLRSTLGRFTDFLDRTRKIFLRIRRAFHLHQADGKFIRHEITLACSFKLAGALFCSSFLGEFVLSICAQFNTNDVSPKCVRTSQHLS